MTFLYNCKSEIDAEGRTAYRITKFDDAMNVESSYLTDGKACGCPAGARPHCRHREMLPQFIARGVVNTEWFYDFDRGGWVQMGVEWIVPLPGGVAVFPPSVGPEPEPEPWPVKVIDVTIQVDIQPERPKAIFMRRRL